MGFKTFGLIALILALLTLPLQTNAQPAAKVWRIGMFHVGLDHVPSSVPGFREGLKALSYEEGKNLHLDWRNLPDEAAAHATAQAFVEERVDLIVALENQTSNNLETNFPSFILQLATAQGVPMPVPLTKWVDEGGRFYYGINYRATGQAAAQQVDKLFKGKPPSTLPVEQPATFDLVVNLKTARELDITIPPTVLYQATKVIQ